MGTSGSVPSENEFEEGKEQPNDNHPTGNRELTERTDEIQQKWTHVKESPDSENKQFKIGDLHSSYEPTEKVFYSLEDIVVNKDPKPIAPPPPPSPPVAPT